MLYVVATPIGNLSEFTFRAVEALKESDVVLCEDTRHSRPLLARYGIEKPLVSYQKFNEKERVEQVLGYLEDGKTISLISDAGMPLISDPGSTLIKALAQKGEKYTVISGACACIDALVLSAKDTSKFCFLGFLPDKKSDKAKTIAKFSDVEATLVFYSPPHDVDDDLNALFEGLGRREISIVREISKVHEEVIFARLGEIPEFTHKGEFVLVVEGAKEKESELNLLSVEDHIRTYLASGMSKKEAVKAVAKDRKTAKSEIYAVAEKMKEKDNE
jgi:16S rRNA (cytidine1402-2'-O)-methyltransferase